MKARIEVPHVDNFKNITFEMRAEIDPRQSALKF